MSDYVTNELAADVLYVLSEVLGFILPPLVAVAGLAALLWVLLVVISVIGGVLQTFVERRLR